MSKIFSCEDANCGTRLHSPKVSQSGLIRRILPLKASENIVFAILQAEELSTKTNKKLGSSVFPDARLFSSLNVDNTSKPAETENFAAVKTRNECRTENVPDANENFPFDFEKGNAGIDSLNSFPSKGSADAQESYKRRRPTSVPVFTSGLTRERKSYHADPCEVSMRRQPNKLVRERLPGTFAPTVLRNHADYVNETDAGNRSRSASFEGMETSCGTLNGRYPCKNALRTNSMRLLNSSTIAQEGAGSQPKNRLQRSNSSSYPRSACGETDLTILGAHHSRISSSNESTASSGCFSRDRGNSSSSSTSVTSNLLPGTINTSAEKLGTNKSPFKYISARMVAERLVRALTKEKVCAYLPRPTNSETGVDLDKQDTVDADYRELNAETGMISNCTFSGKNEEQHFSLRVENKKVQTWSQRLPQARNRKINHSKWGKELVSPKFEIESPHLCKDRTGQCCLWFESCSEDEMCSALEQRAKAREEQAALLEREIELVDDQLTEVITDGQSKGGTVDNFDAFQHEIRSLQTEKRQLALEIASDIRNRLSERGRANNAFQALKEEMDYHVKLLEKDKTDIQESLEAEIERRTAEWTTKMEKIRVEERRLKERVREIAEEKVALQKEVSSLILKESGLRGQVKESQISMNKMKNSAEGAAKEIADLKQLLAESCKQLKSTEDENDTVTRRYEMIERENVDLHRELARSQEFIKDKEKTIHALWQELDQAVNGRSECKGEHIINLQRELLRLTGVEQALQKELEAMSRGLAHVKQENRSLIERYKIVGGGGVVEVVQDNQVVQVQTHALRVQLMKLQDENIKLSAKLRAVTRDRTDAEMTLEILDLAMTGSGLNLISLQNELGVERIQKNSQQLEENSSKGRNLKELFMCLEQNKESQQNLTVETLVCEVLHEKLYSRESELEQLHGEHATLLQSQDWMQTEVDNLHDALYSANKRIQDLEHEICGKDEDIRVLQSTFEVQLEKLNSLQDELSHVRECKDDMRKVIEDGNKEVLRLSVEVEVLTRKVEKLDEDLMMKEGQLAILRGTFTDSD